MGPYCKFCNHRCFVHLPQETPEHILKAYGTSTIVATCPSGQAFEKAKVGFCYDDILEEIEKGKVGVKYTFTSEQLYRILSDTISMFVEYQNVHGSTEAQALPAAISEMFQGLDADRELVESGEVKESLQVAEEANQPPICDYCHHRHYGWQDHHLA